MGSNYGFPGLTPRVGLLHLDKEAFHLRTLWRIRRKPPEKFLGRCGGVAAPALARERDCQGKPRLMQIGIDRQRPLQGRDRVCRVPAVRQHHPEIGDDDRVVGLDPFGVAQRRCGRLEAAR